MRAMLRSRLALLSALVCTPAAAMVGGAAPAGDFARAAVMIVGSRGNFCTGTLIARDLVLTAAHCVPPGADTSSCNLTRNSNRACATSPRIERHPQFSQQAFDNHRATADVALIKLAAPAQNAAQAALFSGNFASRPAIASRSRATA